MAKKKTSNLSNLINTSPKKLLVFLLAFVVIGGGVMAFSSFAAVRDGSASANTPSVTEGAIGVISGGGSSTYRERVGNNYTRHCTDTYLQVSVDGGEWTEAIGTASVPNCKIIAKDPSWGTVSAETREINRPSDCTKEYVYRTYIRGWVDNGYTEAKEKIVSATSSSELLISCATQ